MSPRVIAPGIEIEERRSGPYRGGAERSAVRLSIRRTRESHPGDRTVATIFVPLSIVWCTFAAGAVIRGAPLIGIAFGAVLAVVIGLWWWDVRNPQYVEIDAGGVRAWHAGWRRVRAVDRSQLRAITIEYDDGGEHGVARPAVAADAAVARGDGFSVLARTESGSVAIVTRLAGLSDAVAAARAIRDAVGSDVALEVPGSRDEVRANREA